MGEVLFASEYESTVQIQAEGAGLEDNFAPEVSEDFAVNADDKMSQTVKIKTADEKWMIVTASSDLQPIDEAKQVILMVLPYTLIVCAAISVLVSFFYARAISKPIEKLSLSTVRMRNLEKGVQCFANSSYEIGVLSENINVLYTTLLSAIEKLQEEIKAVTEAERKKLNFMLMASHELKTPITAVRGMIEGMVYQVGVYKDRDAYLGECLKTLDELSKLLYEILDASKLDISSSAQDISLINVGSLVEEVLEEYRVIAMAKQITVYTDLQEEINVSTSAKLLSKALSNIISNSVRYTSSGENVRIYFENRSLIIYNPCQPLSDKEMRHIFEPFYRPDFSHSQETGGNGLGLYITDRILKSCNLQYTFYPVEDGMVFKIDFQNL